MLAEKKKRTASAHTNRALKFKRALILEFH